MSRVIAFELPANDPVRACEFYAAAFGWSSQLVVPEPEYHWINTGDPSMPGIDGAVMSRMHESQPVTVTIQVQDLDQAITAITLAGGVIIVDPFPVMGTGRKAFFKDTEGNIVGIAQLPN